jgi:hypothetical protein
VKRIAQRGLRGGLAGIGLVAALVVAGTVFVSFGAGSSPATAAQAQYAPRVTVAPTISGVAAEGQTLTANPGTWSGDQPIVFTFQWLRCNSAGQNCVTLSGSTSQTYAVPAPDRGSRLRVTVTARNSQGSSSATSPSTAVVTAPPAPAGARRLPNGQTSIPATSVSAPHRLVVDQMTFSPNPVRSRLSPITVRARVLDTRGYVVRGALVFIRSTPVVTDTPRELPTADDGWATFTVMPQRDFPLRPGYSVQFFARARKEGESPLAGVSTRRLTQVGTAR